MSSTFSTTTELFRALSLPCSGYAGRVSKHVFSDVSVYSKVMFSKFTVQDWKSFNKDASKILIGHKNRALNEDQLTAVKSIPDQLIFNPKPESEMSLMARFHQTLLHTVSIICPGNSKTWERQGRSTRRFFELRTPDFILREQGPADSSSSQESDNSIVAAVTGELKIPCLELGSSLSASSLTSLIQHEHFYRLNAARPFFQMFSYLLCSKKGVGVLTNFDEARFFKINLKDQQVLMSPLVRIDQRLDEEAHIPHVLQAYIYVNELPDATTDELSSETAAELLGEAMEETKELVKRLEEEASESSSSHEDTSKAGLSDTNRGGKKGKQSDYEIYTVASRIVEKCQMVGTLGSGLTGHVAECEFEGVRVALKAGIPFDYRDPRDAFSHVESEISIYEKLKELQGSVIPRVLAGCIERFYMASAMVLMTEKVGMGVEMKDEKLFVEGKELGREDLLIIREKGVEGLRKIHECGVIHTDAAIRNIRVDMREGKVERVWWVDFGDGTEIDWEAGMVWDRHMHLLHQSEKEARDVDIESFERYFKGLV